MRFKNDTIVELPPRARRIPLTPMCLRQQQGTTSACAENTVVDHRPRRPRGNYLRVRGEYASVAPSQSPPWELPPRARRIRHRRVARGDNRGTTSACAENTDARYFCDATGWNYLRVRGEYFTALMRCRSTSELPPRARRIHLPAIPEGDDLGTTSACAENTPFCLFIRWGVRNYLRVRGEYTPPAKWCGWSRELPPRARRIHTPSEMVRLESGTTSACAENTQRGPADLHTIWNYLRVRGEYGPPHAG